MWWQHGVVSKYKSNAHTNTQTHSRTHIQTHTNAQNTHTFIFIKVILYSYLKKMNEHITDS